MYTIFCIYPAVFHIFWLSSEEPSFEIHIYYDGSFLRQEQSGIAVIAFILTDTGWKLAGSASATATSFAHTAYDAELWAAILANKLAFDLLKTHEVFHGYVPQVHFLYDSITVGLQADGSWAAFKRTTTGRLLRALSQCIDSRFSQKLRGQHVSGHTGEPGNEIVDHLALSAAKGKASDDLNNNKTQAPHPPHLYRSSQRFGGGALRPPPQPPNPPFRFLF